MTPQTHVMMASHVLGGRVQDEVCAQGDGLLVDGGGEGAVDAHEGPVGMAQGCHALDVYAAQAGVGWRFAEEESDLKEETDATAGRSL